VPPLASFAASFDFCASDVEQAARAAPDTAVAAAVLRKERRDAMLWRKSMAPEEIFVSEILL
jgi:hypothetical protein